MGARTCVCVAAGLVFAGCEADTLELALMTTGPADVAPRPSDGGSGLDAGPSLPSCAPGQALRRIVIEDGSFEPSDWVQAVVVATGDVAADPAERPLTGGATGAFRRVVHRVRATAASYAEIFTHHAYAAHVHDPRGQPICSLDASFEASDAENLPRSREVLVAFAVEQAGVVYATPLESVDANGWIRVSFEAGTLRPIADTGSSELNLAGGEPLRFGLLVANSSPMGSLPQSTFVTGIDNFRVVLTVPAPARSG